MRKSIWQYTQLFMMTHIPRAKVAKADKAPKIKKTGVLQVIKDHKVGVIVVGVAAAVAGVGTYAYQSWKENKREEAERRVEDFKKALQEYLNASRKGNLNTKVVDNLLKSIEELEEKRLGKDIELTIPAAQLAELINSIFTYTESLAKANEFKAKVKKPWEKKKITKKDEKTGEETEVEDYDWEAITKAVKSFVEDYNDVIEKSGESNSKDVLRNAVWLTGITESNENVLSKIGISIGKGNKMELDEEALKKAETGTLKTLFTGHNSFASKVSMKANSISNAAARASGTYKSNGTYNSALSELASSKVDKEV